MGKPRDDAVETVSDDLQAAYTPQPAPFGTVLAILVVVVAVVHVLSVFTQYTNPDPLEPWISISCICTIAQAVLIVGLIASFYVPALLPPSRRQWVAFQAFPAVETAFFILGFLLFNYFAWTAARHPMSHDFEQFLIAQFADNNIPEEGEGFTFREIGSRDELYDWMENIFMPFFYPGEPDGSSKVARDTLGIFTLDGHTSPMILRARQLRVTVDDQFRPFSWSSASSAVGHWVAQRGRYNPGLFGSYVDRGTDVGVYEGLRGTKYAATGWEISFYSSDDGIDSERPPGPGGEGGTEGGGEGSGGGGEQPPPGSDSGGSQDVGGGDGPAAPASNSTSPANATEPTSGSTGAGTTDSSGTNLTSIANSTSGDASQPQDPPPQKRRLLRTQERALPSFGNGYRQLRDRVTVTRPLGLVPAAKRRQLIEIDNSTAPSSISDGPAFIGKLREAGWVDAQTRAVFVDFVVFSPIDFDQECIQSLYAASETTLDLYKWLNSRFGALARRPPIEGGCLTSVEALCRFVVEFDAAGSVLPSFEVTSRSTDTATFRFGVFLQLYGTFFLLMLLGKAFLQGWFVLQDLWTFFDVAVIALLTLASQRASASVDETCGEDCDAMAFAFTFLADTVVFRDLLAAASVLIWWRLMKPLSRLSPSMRSVLDTLMLAIRTILSTLVLIAIVVCAFSVTFFVLFGGVNPAFRTPYKAILSLTMALAGELDMEPFAGVHRLDFLGPMLSSFYTFVLNSVLLVIFVAIIDSKYELARERSRGRVNPITRATTGAIQRAAARLQHSERTRALAHVLVQLTRKARKDEADEVPVAVAVQRALSALQLASGGDGTEPSAGAKKALGLLAASRSPRSDPDGGQGGGDEEVSTPATRGWRALRGGAMPAHVPPAPHARQTPHRSAGGAEGAEEGKEGRGAADGRATPPSRAADLDQEGAGSGSAHRGRRRARDDRRGASRSRHRRDRSRGTARNGDREHASAGAGAGMDYYSRVVPRSNRH